MKTQTTVLIIILLILGLVACSDENETPNGENNPNPDMETEVCMHMEGGPYKAVTAAEDSTDTLANIAIPHTRVDVELAGEGPNRGGSVSFEATSEAEYVFFLSHDVGFVLADSNAMALTPEASTGPSKKCPTAILASHTFDLQVGTYTITMGPADLETLGILFEAGEHEH